MFFMGAVVLLVGVVGIGEDLDWSDDYNEAKLTANAERTPLLVVLENPTIERERFDDKRLASDTDQIELLKNYTLCRIDVTTAYGQRVAKAFKVRGLPYVVLTDKTANFITLRKPGPIGSESWIEDLSSHLSGEIPGTNLVYRTNRLTVSDPVVNYDNRGAEGIVYSNSTFVTPTYKGIVYDGDSYGSTNYDSSVYQSTNSSSAAAPISPQVYSPSFKMPAYGFPSLQPSGST